MPGDPGEGCAQWDPAGQQLPLQPAQGPSTGHQARRAPAPQPRRPAAPPGRSQEAGAACAAVPGDIGISLLLPVKLFTSAAHPQPVQVCCLGKTSLGVYSRWQLSWCPNPVLPRVWATPGYWLIPQSQGGVRCEERTYRVGPVYEMRLWNPVFYISSMCACFKFIHSFSTYLLGTCCMLNSRCWACSTESDQSFALRAFTI